MNNSIKKWLTNIHSNDEFVAIDALDNIPKTSIDLSSDLIDLARSENTSELVRQAAVEALSNFDTEKVRDCLRNLIINEQSDLVKEYAISSLGEIGNLKDLKFIIDIIEKKISDEVLVHVYLGIFLAAKNVAIKELLSIMKNGDDIIKSSSINALKYMLLSFCSEDICDSLKLESKKRPTDDVCCALKLYESAMKILCG